MISQAMTGMSGMSGMVTQKLQAYQDAVIALNPISYFPGQDASGNLIDFGSSGDDAVSQAAGATYRYNTNPPPMGGYAIDFDGVGWFLASGLTAPTDENVVTICCWIRFDPDPAGITHPYAIGHASEQYYYRLRLADDVSPTVDYRFAFNSAVSDTYSERPNVSNQNDTWHFMVGRSISTTSRSIFVDKSAGSANTDTRDITTGKIEIAAVGANNLGNSPFIGQGCHFTYYGYALSVLQLNHLYDLAVS